MSVLSRQRRDADITHGGVIDTWSAGPGARYAAGARMRVDAKVLWGETVQRGAYAPPGFAVLAAPGSRVALCQVHGFTWVTLEGTGTVVDDPARVTLGAGLYAKRYWSAPPNPPGRVVIEIAVDRVLHLNT